MSQHSAFLLGKALAAIRRDNPTLYERLLADVSPLDMPGVKRGLGDPVRRTERADDMRALVMAVRTR